MADGPTADGFVNYLIYLVVALASSLVIWVQRSFGLRITKVEDKSETTTEAIHTMETSLTEKITSNNDDWNRQFEDRRKENKEDFRRLHDKIDDNQKTIIDTINGLKK